MKIVVNKCFGGFGISKECAKFMASKGSERAKKELEDKDFYGYGYVDGMEGGYERTDPLLVEAVETLGDVANGSCASLRVIEIPDGISWEMDEYDGIESIHETHRSW
jgi:hypothetical protein